MATRVAVWARVAFRVLCVRVVLEFSSYCGPEKER